MKKQLLNSILTIAASTGFLSLGAQAITENFAPNPQAIFTNGWAQQNLSTPVGTVPNWFNGNATVFPAFSAPDSSYIACNFNSVAGAATISNWLFAPTRTFNNGDVITFYTRTVSAPAYPDRLQLRLSLSGTSVNVGTTNTSVGNFTTLLLDINPTLTTTGYPSTWTLYTVTISGLAGPTSGRVAFRYFVTNGGPSGANSDFVGIDNFTYTPAGQPNVTAGSYTDEYTLIPLAQVTAFNLSDTIRNIGSAVANNSMLTVKVYVAPNFTTPVQTTTSSTATIAVSGFAALSAGTYLPTDTGFYVFEFISSCTGNLVNASDTAYYGFTVTDSTYGRDDGNITGALGIGAGNGGYLGNSFEITTPTKLTTITSAYNRGYTGEPYAAVVWNTVSGVPNAIIGSTDTLLYASDSFLVATVNMHGGPLVLMPGIYVVTAVEFDSTVQVSQTNTIFTLGTTWVNWPTSPANGWANNEYFGVSTFNRPYVIRPNLNCNSANTQNLSVCYGGSVTVGSSTYSAAGTYTDTFPNVFGCDSILTTILTVNPIITSTNNASICAGGYVTVGTNTYNTAGTYVDTLTTLSGCDSVVTTNLSVDPILYTSNTVTVCYGGSVTVGLNTYTASGTYNDTLQSPFGCDSLVTTNLTVIPLIDTSTTVNGYVITANDTTASSYQWIDCNNGGAPINGETNFTFAPSANGNYALIVTVGPCSDTSGCIAIIGLGLNSGSAAGVLSVYPNPNSGDFVISSVEAGTYVITNQLGQTVATAALNQQNNYRASFTNLAPGVYLISGYAGEKFVSKRVVINE